MNALVKHWIRLAALGLVVACAACSDDDNNAKPDSPVINLPDAPKLPDASSTPSIDSGTAGPDAPASADCISGTPVTNDDLINACTTAQKLTYAPTLPLLNGDGTLPAHP